MRTEQLKYLLEVASCGSISAAAKQLYINQTTLSAAIQSIETELGGKLFLRTAKGVVLSPFGESAMPKIQEMFSQYEALLLLEGGNAQIPAQLHVCISSCACHFWSIHLTETLRQQEIKTRLIVHESSGNQVLPTVTEGKASIGIGGCYERKLSLFEEQAEKSNLVIEPLYIETPYIYVSADSPLAQEKMLVCSDMGDYHMALNNCCLERFYSGRFAKCISQLSVFSSLETAKDAVRRSDMFCVLPQIAMEGQQEDRLVAIPMAEAKEESFLSYIIHPHSKDMNAVEQIVVDSIKTWCRENRPMDSSLE